MPDISALDRPARLRHMLEELGPTFVKLGQILSTRPDMIGNVYAEELKNLIGEKAFVLSSGNLKIMDLCYCPFAKTCSTCDKRTVYHLTDEDNRVFPVRRYLSADGQCRFEVFNCADLIGKGVERAGKLLDLTLERKKEQAIEARDNETEQKNIYDTYTSGHLKRGVL